MAPARGGGCQAAAALKAFLVLAFLDGVAGAPFSYIPWRWQPEGAAWGRRSNFATASLQDGRVLVLGGSNRTNVLNDVWLGSVGDMGVAWTLGTSGAPWSRRTRSSAVTLLDGSILLLGGTDGDFVFFADVWLSRPGPGVGTVWEQRLEAAPWGARAGFAAVTARDGSVLIMGGCCGYKNDVWRSVPGTRGATWNLATANAGWAPRMGHAAVALPRSSLILVLGGMAFTNQTTYFNDVWLGTMAGDSWVSQTSAAPWSGRSDFAAVALSDGSILVLLGRTSMTSAASDVWRSPPGDNGVHWAQQLAVPSWSGRAGFGAPQPNRGGVLVLGGYACQGGVCELVDDTYRRESMCDFGTGPINGSLGDCPRFVESGGTCNATCNRGFTGSGATTTTCSDGILTQVYCQPLPCAGIVAPANGSIGDCPTSLPHGGSCQPVCDRGLTPSGPTTCSLGQASIAKCWPNPCVTSGPPENGGLGDCPAILPSSATCQPTCNDGYTVTGAAVCSAGRLILPSCLAQACSVAEAPADGDLGDCPLLLASGATCQPGCRANYTAAGPAVCQSGQLQMPQCVPPPCDASAPPEHGSSGNCTDVLPSGGSCQPKCDPGYAANGRTTCEAGVLAAAGCYPKDGCNTSQIPNNALFQLCNEMLLPGESCLPSCSFGTAPAGRYTCLRGTLQLTGNFTCVSQNCGNISAPAFGGLGTCKASLRDGAWCDFVCKKGYTASGRVGCSAGVLRPATCLPDPCDIDAFRAAPDNGNLVGCPPTLPSGAHCLPSCDAGYALQGDFFCQAGKLSRNATCIQVIPSNASSNGTADNVTGANGTNATNATAAIPLERNCSLAAAPVDGSWGNCTAVLASGVWCRFSCDDGFEVTGPTICTNGTITPSTCREDAGAGDSVSVYMTVVNVNLAALLASSAVLADFMTGVQRVIAREAGAGVSPSDVSVGLSPGSVVVEATVNAPGGSADDLRHNLYSNRQAMAKAVTKVVADVKNIKVALTGKVAVQDVHIEGVVEETTTTTAAPTTTTKTRSTRTSTTPETTMPRTSTRRTTSSRHSTDPWGGSGTDDDPGGGEEENTTTTYPPDDEGDGSGGESSSGGGGEESSSGGGGLSGGGGSGENVTIIYIHKPHQAGMRFPLVGMVGIAVGAVCLCTLGCCGLAYCRITKDGGEAEGYQENLGFWMWPLGCLFGADVPKLPARGPLSWV